MAESIQVTVNDSQETVSINVDSGSYVGTVTSVAVSGSDGIDVDSGSPITTSGTIALGLNEDASQYPFVIDEDNMASDSATKVPTQQSVKAYVDAATGGSFEYQTPITTNTTLSTQKGEWKMYPVNSESAVQITVPSGVYALDEIINFERRGQGSLEFITDGYSKIRGVRDGDNRYFVNDPNSMVSLVCRGIDEFVAIGNLTRGYSGIVTISSYSGTLYESGVGNIITVYGTGFSENMRINVDANATLNDWTFVSSTEITLDLDAVGVEDDTVTITYYNGDDLVDTDALTIAAPFVSVIVYQDPLNDSSVDSAIWDTVTDANGVITETGTQLELTASGVTNPNWYGLRLKNAVGSANDLVIAQFRLNWDNSIYIIPRIGLCQSTYSDNDIAVFQRHNASPYNKFRCIIVDGGSVEINPDTGHGLAKEARIKYVPSTGAITFEYWSGTSWDEFPSSAGNVDLGSTVKVVIYNKTTAGYGSQLVSAKDFYISDNDYSTQYPL